MKKQQEKAGFTIIEVVLVLAIAGLIFLMVFVGLPALQRSQRDTQRRNDMSRLVTQLIQYQANNNGNVPIKNDEYTNANTGFLKVYMKRDTSDSSKSEFNDPLTGLYYKVNSVTKCTEPACDGTKQAVAGASLPTTRNIVIYPHATCNGENPLYKSGANVAFVIKLESGGYYCAHN